MTRAVFGVLCEAGLAGELVLRLRLRLRLRLLLAMVVLVWEER